MAGKTAELEVWQRSVWEERVKNKVGCSLYHKNLKDVTRDQTMGPCKPEQMLRGTHPD